jgi:predicted amidohydrolase YtcJ
MAPSQETPSIFRSLLDELKRRRVVRATLAYCAAAFTLLALCSGCEGGPAPDIVLLNGKVYTFTWSEPAADGSPARDAPHDSAGWHPDAEAVVIRGDRILYVGTNDAARQMAGASTRMIDLLGATVVPGLIDSHVHLDSYAEKLSQVDLVGVVNEQEAVRRVAEWIRTRRVPAGQWVVGYGWDDGAWSTHYPTLDLLSRTVPDHPVALRGLHGFAIWGNRLALERAGITSATRDPAGGEIVRDQVGRPTGILRDRAVPLLLDVVAPLTAEEFQARVLEALDSMGAAGIVSVVEGNAGARIVRLLQRLDTSGRLPIRVGVMLATQGPDPDTSLLREWLTRGPMRADSGILEVRAVKAFYDGAMGSRGALLLEDYSDQPEHRGRGGDTYGFSRDWLTQFAAAGFQVVIHAIGDGANRQALDFFDSLYISHPRTRDQRNRIEHAQVVAPSDLPRFGQLDVLASIQLIHAMDDMPWAEQRIGGERIRGAYAWRSLRQAAARLAFSSDMPGADHHIFQQLHAAVTRTNARGEPRGGWYPEQRLTPEEALRGYTTWAAWATSHEQETGTLAAGKWADLTIMDIDPLALTVAEYDRILGGRIVLTLVGGRVVYQSRVTP